MNADLEVRLQVRRGPVVPGFSELSFTIGTPNEKRNRCQKPFQWSGIRGENAIFCVSQRHMALFPGHGLNRPGYVRSVR